MNAAEIVWRAVGSPAVPGCVSASGLCWMCAARLERGIPRQKWMGANFVGQNRVRAPAAAFVCEPCVFVCAGRPPDTLRMYSHFWSEPAGWSKLTRADRAKMRERILAEYDGPWFAAIAESGKKHLLPWTPINFAGARVIYFEERRVSMPLDARELLDDLARLLAAGASKAEIGRGEYTPFSWRACHDEIRAFEARWSRARHGSWFDLALWLAGGSDGTA